MRCRKNYRVAIATVRGYWIARIVATAKALHYWHAAQRDERAGFLYTAALEWRHVADLFPNTHAAEYSWQQWERIMHLPRRFAGPVYSAPAGAFPEQARTITALPAAMFERDTVSRERRRHHLAGSEVLGYDVVGDLPICGVAGEIVEAPPASQSLSQPLAFGP
jgi:hypothetical protein